MEVSSHQKYHQRKSVYAMMISLLGNLINGLDHKSWTKNLQTFLDVFAVQSGIKRFREYRLLLDHKEYPIRIPILDEDGDYTLYWPAGLLRRRAYPLAVYLFAVCIYLTGGLSMREAAAVTRKQFGLERFSHSTISRTKKKLFDLLENFILEFPELPTASDTLQESSLVKRLRRMLEGMLIDPFFHAENLALRFFHRYQVFLM